MPVVRMPQVSNGEGLSHQASLLVSILVRYMEIGSVRFSATDERLVFTFMLKGSFSAADIAAFKQVALSHLEAYAEVTGHIIAYLGVTGVTHGNYTQVEITRDVASLSREELSLLIGLIRVHFGQNLLVEPEEPLHDEERAMQEALIDHTLEDVRSGGPHKELVGFRESGRVMVFNKAPHPEENQG